ncbi:MAG TPA: hypothetical protein VN081_06525 [Dongiaceae bacterium]|nr:hypothetical protein [Dongiaceae bacterium]
MAGIRAELARALIEAELTLVRTSSETPVEGVFEVPPYVKSIPPYTHPMIMDPRSWNSGCPDVVVDTRAFTKSAGQGSPILAASGQQADWDFFKLYARLAHRWVCGYANDFKHLGHVAPTVFIRWLSGVVVSRLNLSPFEHVGVTAVTGYYFYCLFLNREDVDGSEKLKISQQVARVTQIPATKVLEYIDRITEAPMDINGYVTALREAVDTSRFDKFTPALVYQMIVGHWWGAHAREVIAVALEYPPAFYAILFTAFTNKGVKRSVFADQALKIKRGDEDTQFALAVGRFIEV